MKHQIDYEELNYKQFSNEDLATNFNVMKERYANWDNRKALEELEDRIIRTRSNLKNVPDNTLIFYALGSIMQPEFNDIFGLAVKKELLGRVLMNYAISG